jgi:hypothetical protein
MKHGNRSTAFSGAAVGVLSSIWRAVFDGVATYGAGLHGFSWADLVDLNASDASDAESSQADRASPPAEATMPVSLSEQPMNSFWSGG